MLGLGQAFADERLDRASRFDVGQVREVFDRDPVVVLFRCVQDALLELGDLGKVTGICLRKRLG